MPPRALIIGIEQYPQATDLAQTIAGATNNAEQFFDWVTTVKRLNASDTYVCAQGGSFTAANRFLTDRDAIVDAIAALVNAGQDQTDELFVYFSGHGYGFRQSLERRAVDVLIASDYRDAATGGTKCLKLQEVQEKLYAVLGGAHHYYFVDACRNLIDDDAIDPIGLGRVLGHPAQRGSPTKYTLYSTAYGTTAAINSGFGQALIEGLHGKGRAKGFAPSGTMYVMFPLLCSYVQSRIRDQRLDQNKDGTGDGYIVEVLPVPTYTCTIEIQDAASTQTFEAKLSIAGNPAMAQRQTFTGSTCALPFAPGNLILDVSAGGTLLTRIDPPPDAAIDFWDDCKAMFRSPAVAMPPPPAPPAPGPPGAVPPVPEPQPTTVAHAAKMSVAALPNVTARATNLLTGEQHTIGATETRMMAAGVYEVTLEENGVAIDRSVTTVAAGTERRLAGDPMDPVRASIVSAVGGDPNRGVVAFSETLGDMANRDLGLWLAIMGASRIVADPSTFSKLKALPLADVTSFPPNSSGIYVIGASMDGAPPAVKVGGQAVAAEFVPALTGIFQSLAPASMGSQLVTIAIGSSAPRTFASFCLPNRLTLIVCSPGSRGQLRVNQLILPMFHLYGFLDPTVADRVRQDATPLRTIRASYSFQAQFGAKREIKPVTPPEIDAWFSLLYGKWLDPVMSLLACYEMLRRGDGSAKAMIQGTVIPNLDRYFPGLPDTSAVAALLQKPRGTPLDPPLFREGLLAFPEWDHGLKMPADALDFNYIWTAWRGSPGV